MMKKIQKGFTLTEIIIAIILTSMVGLLIGLVFNTMFSGRNIIEREASIQSEMRTSMQYVDRTIGKATSVFVLDESKYGKDVRKTEGWNYIGLSPDGKKVINYIWNKTTKRWDESVLGTNSLYDMQLDLEFKADESYQDNRLINYNLTGQYKNSKNKLSIDTAISALNTKQVISKVAKGKKGVALAYRNDPIEGQVNTAVSFVFDTSGSMAYGLWNQKLEPTDSRTRMNILKTKANLLVDDLKEIGNVSVNLVRFSGDASYIQEDFVELDKDTETIKTKIKALPTSWITNPGDGLRYGLVSLQRNPAQLKYVVLLTDGIPNAYTASPDGIGKYDLTANFPTNGKQIKADQPVSLTTEYVGQVAKTFGSGVKRISVIGFSGNVKEIKDGQKIADQIKTVGKVDSTFVIATNEAALEQTFADIKKQIQQDLWFVSGP
ncbi:VWA domain-containing protein [Streptococcus sanguinis]|uniref:VWA domain-containing protein n=1 Tax=Streptococcus sanguinis TaxID=1305 RepID=UPI001CC16742|nr:VWA domain-containing protein [Streptococcus sanguinis]MBZ2021211.1 VWA domain-containing protein [Streptococcus sanguinis]MBZ2069328.1 VWA domain-containing protein [Streptococcus sanguinis]MBZ2074033.1 VWA domain-containing protein [Streptococcus sanguinis]MBZ2082370.1 VWA domain-containing protein [Streptococcus sanguinis]